MGKTVSVTVKFPNGRPAISARILGFNHDAWDKKHHGEWHATAEEGGSHTFDNLDSGTLGDRYTFEATIVDEEGVRWSGEVSERIKRDVDLTIVLAPSYSVDVEIPSPVKRTLERSEEGRQLLEGIRELKAALGAGLLRSPVVVSTWILEGLIQIKAKAEGKWRDGFSALTFGQLVANKEILAMFPSGIQPRVLALADFRTPSAHNTGAAAHVAEGQLAASIVVDTAASWFGGGAQGPPSASSPGIA